MNTLYPFSELWYENFTVAINPISVKIFEREGCTAFGMTVNGILSTHLVFLRILKYIPRLVYSLRRGLTNETTF
jgi:hypothetical protein